MLEYDKYFHVYSPSIRDHEVVFKEPGHAFIPREGLWEMRHCHPPFDHRIAGVS